MRILFVGDIVTGRPIIDSILHDHELIAVAVGAEHQYPAAKRLGVEIFLAREINTEPKLEQIRRLDLDLIVNFNSTVIFRESLLESPRIGAINFHPGLLPEYAGLNVHQWALLNGELETGVTIHVMTSGIDEGAIIARETIGIEPEDTGLTLYMKLLRVGAALMAGVLKNISKAGFSNAWNQEAPHRHIYGAKDRPKGRIDFHNPMDRIARFVRALSYRPFVSPLGPPFLLTPNGALEIALVSTAPFKEGEKAKPGTIIAMDAAELVIACLDGKMSARACYLAEEKTDFDQAAECLGLGVGIVV